MRTLCGITATLVLCAACGANDHRGVSLGTFAFTGQTRVGPRPAAVDNGVCKADVPLISWTTTLVAGASDEQDKLWITENAYGCTVLAPLRGSVIDASGLSCPVSGAGFFLEDFSEFRWDFQARTLLYGSTLWAQDATGVLGTWCAEVTGSITPL